MRLKNGLSGLKREGVRADKKRLIQWDIPYIIAGLKKEYGLSISYLTDEQAFAPIVTKSFILNGCTAFPLFTKGRSLGMLICYRVLTPEQQKHIRGWIDKHLNINPPVEYDFPVLLEGVSPSDIVQQAHAIYLQSRAFAFVNTDDLQWSRGTFKKMEGVFVCVPFFHLLSLKQKQVLRQELSYRFLSCPVVVGVRPGEVLPPQWQDLFSVMPEGPVGQESQSL